MATHHEQGLGPTGHERRSEHRLEILLEAQYRLAKQPTFRSGTILNIGAGGAGLMLEDPLEPGEAIAELVFALPDGDFGGEGRTLKLEGTVVRSSARSVPGRESNFVHGLEFQGLGDRTRDRIRRFVVQRLAARAAPPPPGTEPGLARVRFVRPVSIRVERIGRSFNEVSTNLSESGMFLRRDNPPPPGAVFTLRFALGDVEPAIECRSEVVWTRRSPEGADRPAGMGIRFLDLTDGERERVRRIVDSGEKLPEDDEPPP